MRPAEVERQKRAAAEAAVAEIEDGMMIGLGTGSTIDYAIAELARRSREGLRVVAVATSNRTDRAARAAGITLVAFDRMDRVDLAIDGVDEIDGSFQAIKGAGGAMLREKIVASAADRMIAIADVSKKVDRLGAAPVPVEVVPFGHGFVLAALRTIGAVPRLRGGRNKPYRTDQGNLVIDCAFGRIDDPSNLAATLSSIPGLLGHGIFREEIDTLFLGVTDGVIRSDRPARA
ncbi:ribose-5-phosphate isomerase RpiA [Rhizorhabdus argentea]|uniref:ribose-5-phosphate isomerase RpiA n=1 Tax=Rhizorhabdus argentea TaxID=1387174 RepID=UPI0030EBEADD